MNNTKNITQRKKISIDKQKLWDLFDNVVGKEKDSDRIERLYSSGTVEERYKCEYCTNKLAYGDNKFLICTKCGIIYKDLLDQSAEWRYYGCYDTKSANPTRCGMPINPLLRESSYGCKVLCNTWSTYEMKKIRRYTEWQSMPYKEKSQYDEFERIKLLARNAELPKIIIDEALRYHKKISQEQRFRGCNRAGILAASIYIGSRIHNLPRTAKEIATMFHLDNTSATRGCKNAIDILNKIEKDMKNVEKTHFCETKPISFVDRYCSKLNINSELTKLTRFVALWTENENLMPENSPHSVAAGIVYFISRICHLNITKKDVNLASQISEVTINKCYKKLLLIKEQLIPTEILQKYS